MTGGPYYLRLSRDRVSVRNVSTGEIAEVSSKLGLDSSNTILSVGEPVDPAAVRVLTPFQHPRVLIDDFIGGEKIVQYAIRELFGKKFISPSPVVVLHPDLELDGGLTQIEARALREMAEGAGARRVYLHYGRPLTDKEVLDISTGALEEQY